MLSTWSNREYVIWNVENEGRGIVWPCHALFLCYPRIVRPGSCAVLVDIIVFSTHRSAHPQWNRSSMARVRKRLFATMHACAADASSVQTIIATHPHCNCGSSHCHRRSSSASPTVVLNAWTQCQTQGGNSAPADCLPYVVDARDVIARAHRA